MNTALGGRCTAVLQRTQIFSKCGWRKTIGRVDWSGKTLIYQSTGIIVLDVLQLDEQISPIESRVPGFE